MHHLPKPGFHRIGNNYAHFVNPNQFWGRRPFEDSWLAPERNQSPDQKEFHLLRIALPGFSKQDIDVTLQYDTLKVRANTNDHDSADFVKRGHNEEFAATYFISDQYDKANITCQFKEGILLIKLPLIKDATGRESKKITIQ